MDLFIFRSKRTSQPDPYIDSQGKLWDSRYDHDLALSASGFMENFERWNLSGGQLAETPNAWKIITEVCAPENYQAAFEECEKALELYFATAPYRAMQAIFN